MNMKYEIERTIQTLKATRKSSGMSQRELSERSGVPQSQISRIESMDVNLTVASLSSLANALGLELALVPRKIIPTLRALTRSADRDHAESPRPAYRLDDND